LFIRSVSWSWGMNMYLVSSAFSSSPNSILANTKMSKKGVHSHVYTENSYSKRSRSSGALKSNRREPASQYLLSRINVVARCSRYDSRNITSRVRILTGEWKFPGENWAPVPIYLPHEYQMQWSVLEHESLQRETGEWPPETWQGECCQITLHRQ
jgi:hypothetical protein